MRGCCPAWQAAWKRRHIPSTSSASAADSGSFLSLGTSLIEIACTTPSQRTWPAACRSLAAAAPPGSLLRLLGDPEMGQDEGVSVRVLPQRVVAPRSAAVARRQVDLQEQRV